MTVADDHGAAVRRVRKTGRVEERRGEDKKNTKKK
jgi:hypothetical protein